MKLLVRLIISAIAVLICDLLLSGVSLGDMGDTHGLVTALITAAVLGLLNAFLKPLLILFTLVVPTLLWAQLDNVYLWIAIGVTVGFGAIGFADDLLKVRKRRNLGLKYHRVTGRGVALGDKQPYVRSWALERAAQHAQHFMEGRQRQVQAAGGLGPPPVVVSPFDAELFGHWWYEGPEFLDYLFRKLHFDQDVVKPITPPEYLARHPECELAQPPMCTWGARGYSEVWLNPGNDWIYPHLEVAAERMVELARRFESPTELERRGLNQAARELLLAQSSDWAFIMKTGTTVAYAQKRTRDHIARFTYLHKALIEASLEEAIVKDFEWRDNIFPNVDYRVYR